MKAPRGHVYCGHCDTFVPQRTYEATGSQHKSGLCGLGSLGHGRGPAARPAPAPALEAACDEPAAEPEQGGGGSSPEPDNVPLVGLASVLAFPAHFTQQEARVAAELARAAVDSHAASLPRTSQLDPGQLERLCAWAQDEDSEDGSGVLDDAPAAGVSSAAPGSAFSWFGGAQQLEGLVQAALGVSPAEHAVAGATWDLSGDDLVFLDGEAADAEQDLVDSGDPEVEPRKGTAAWWRYHRFDPVLPNSDVSVLGYAFAALVDKQESNIPDGFFDRNLRLFRRALKGVVPPDSIMVPPSLHLMRAIVGCHSPEEFEYHACLCGQWSWEHTPRSEWSSHADDKCPCCNHSRFERKQSPTGIVLQPWLRYYDLGIENLIRDRLFADPEFCAQRGQDRRTDDPASLYGASMAQAINRLTGGLLYHPDSSAYEIGFDFGQTFTFAQHSTGVIMFRCADLSHKYKSKRSWCLPVIIIPPQCGREPSDMLPYILRLVLAFRNYGPEGRGLVVTEHLEQPDGSLKTRTFEHTIFLTGVHADSMARNKLTKWMGVGAWFACGWCLFHGTRTAAGDSMCYKGYSRPEPQTLNPKAPAGGVQIGTAAHQALKLTDPQQHERGRKAAAGEEVDGAKGHSFIHRILSYASYNDIWVVPLAHAALLGVVKQYANLLFATVKRGEAAPWYVVPHSTRHIFRQRAKEITLTSDFNRPYRCIVDARGDYTMEDWKHFLATYSLYIFKDGLHPVAKQMWDMLRSALLHYLEHDDFSQEVRRTASRNLHKYAALVQELMPDRLLTYNLHMLKCRPYDQETARGRMNEELEFWVERIIQWVKSGVKYRTSAVPELLIMGDLLLDSALASVRARAPAHARTFDELVPEYRSRPLEGPKVDQGDAATGTQLLNKARPFKDAEEDARVRSCLRALLKASPPAGWSEADADTAALDWFTQADKCGDEILGSRLHARARTRESYHAVIRYRGRTENVKNPWLAEIQYFVRARKVELQAAMSASSSAAAGGGAASNAGAAPPVVRAALCNVHRLSVVAGGGGMCRVSNIEQPHEIRLQHIDEIDTKFAIARPAAEAPAAYLLPYCNVSGMR